MPRRAIRVASAVLLVALVPPLAARNLVQAKQFARDQFAVAQRMREELNGRPSDQRTRRDYQQVTEAFRRVYHVSPTSSKADSAVLAAAELLAESGRRFSDAKILRSAIAQYEFLRREYPGSKYRVNTLFTIAQIYRSDLNDNAQAKATWEEFLTRYPRSRLVDDARAALAELEQSPQQPKNGVAGDSQPAPDRNTLRQKREDKREEREEKESGGRELLPVAAATGQPLPLVTGIRHWSTPDYTRVAIDLEAEVQYQAGRVPNPDRIFFDLHNTKLASTLVGKSFEVQDGLLRKIRVAQYVKGITRVVLEVDDLSDYSAFLLPNPYRLIIDIHGRATAPVNVAAAKGLPATEGPKEVRKQATREVANQSGLAREREKAEGPAARKPPGAAAEPAAEKVRPAAASPVRPAGSPWTKVADGTTSPLKPELDEAAQNRARVANREKPAIPAEDRTVRKATATAKTSGVPEAQRPAEMRKSTEAKTPVASARTTALSRKPAPELAPTKPVPSRAVARDHPQGEDADTVTVAHLDPPALNSSKPSSAPTFEAVAPRTPGAVAPARGKIAPPSDTQKGKRHTPTDAAIHQARPAANGERSLTRALGLKIGRIVVDAGHGGHDTGTIGPKGMQEKDLTLDIALRLGKLLETKLNANVIYTRDDDTFIPLETRTAIANQNQADLFISIHANSSHQPSARGVETYYLNFTSSADALEVAARENAVSDKSIHELQDLVKKIALKEKMDESREFAAEVQKSLWTGLAAKTPAIHNRGVKKAPFIVLIGANMPSVLAEISFLSNPTDERRLETPGYRQKIAECLYRGIARYANGLSGVKLAQQR